MTHQDLDHIVLYGVLLSCVGGSLNKVTYRDVLRVLFGLHGSYIAGIYSLMRASGLDIHKLYF